MLGYIASNYKKSNYKIVLSEQVYTRLLGLINLCGLNINGEYDEFGSLFYGKFESNGVIFLESPSEVQDYQIQSKSFSMTDSMWKELESKIDDDNCRIFAHFHTHPYFQDDRNRLYSTEDISFYQNLAIGLNNNRKNEDQIIVLGCMASVSGRNISSLDDISFVYYDTQQHEMIYVPSIFVKIGNQEYELEHVPDEYSYNGVSFPIDRTLLEINTDESQKRHR